MDRAKMLYCFRHRFRLPEVGKLGFEQQQLELSGGVDVPRVWLAAVGDKPLDEVAQAVLRGEGFESEEEAAVAADFWRGVLERSFAAVQVGVDFGDRAPRGGGPSLSMRDELETRFGHPVLNDTHGLATFPCDPSPVFIGMSGKGFAPLAQASWQRAVEAAVRADPLSAKERVAYDVYSASFFVAGEPDARFMMLMMALETLIEQSDRSNEVREHVDGLIRATEESGLEEDEKASLEGSLRWLHVESIAQAGKRLADRLEGRKYGGRHPRRFFRDCYEVRHQLVHGHNPRPDRGEVGRLASDLERYVGDLLAGPTVMAAVRR